jgi:hypothetical protein
LFIDAAFKRVIVKLGRGELVGDIDGVRISLDERLDDDEDRLLHIEEDDDDEVGERKPPVEIMDGAEDKGDSSGGVTDVLVVISIGFGIFFLCDCCSKFFRNSDTFGYVNDSVSDGVRADIAETVVNELVVIVVDDCKA